MSDQHPGQAVDLRSEHVAISDWVTRYGHLNAPMADRARQALHGYDAEVERLQAELTALRSHNQALQSVMPWPTFLGDYYTLRSQNQKLTQKLEDRRDEIARIRAVIKKAHLFDDVVAEFGFNPAYVASEYQPLHDALAALDAATASPEQAG